MPVDCPWATDTPYGAADPTAATVMLRPGVAMPDWSAVTAAAARTSLAAIIETQGLTKKLSHIDQTEDTVWRTVLSEYAALARAPTEVEIARRAGVSAGAVLQSLRSLRARDLVVLDEAGERLTGAYPFTERATSHRVRLGKGELNAMCAIDALAVGAMYRADTAIESSCQHCGQQISIATREAGTALRSVVPEPAVVWTGFYYANNCAATSLCRVLTFFCGDDHLEAWRAANPQDGRGVRLTIEEAMQVGKAIFLPMLAVTGSYSHTITGVTS